MSTEELPEVPLFGNDWTIKEAWWAGYYACEIENNLDLFGGPRMPFPDTLLDGEELIPSD